MFLEFLGTETKEDQKEWNWFSLKTEQEWNPHNIENDLKWK